MADQLIHAVMRIPPTDMRCDACGSGRFIFQDSGDGNCKLVVVCGDCADKAYRRRVLIQYAEDIKHDPELAAIMRDALQFEEADR